MIMGRPKKIPREIWLHKERCIKMNWEDIERLESKVEKQEKRIEELEKSTFDKIKEKLRG